MHPLVCIMCVFVQELGVIDNPNYKITFMLDSAAMITVHTPKRGVVEVYTCTRTHAHAHAHAHTQELMCVVLAGEAAGRRLGKVRGAVQQEEHHHVRRHRTQLPHEPAERPEGKAASPSVPVLGGGENRGQTTLNRRLHVGLGRLLVILQHKRRDQRA